MTDASNIEIIRPEWPAPENIFACSTTRSGGFSRENWHGFNLATHVGDNDVHVRKNRLLLASSLPLPATPVWLDQVHGCAVAVADQAGEMTSCDASMTHKAGVVCAVLTADCLPLLLCNQEGTQVAAVHAGWRGLAAGVIEAAVQKMSCPAEEILAWMGPAIGPADFEVGSEVRQAFVAHDVRASEAFCADPKR